LQSAPAKVTRCGHARVPFVNDYYARSAFAITSAVNAVGNGKFMAKVIEFYIPRTFRKMPKWSAQPDKPGKLIEFRVPEKKSA